jgi:hypothetical protein
MFLIKAFTVWLLIIFAESIHGTLRQIFLAPIVGDFQARQIAFFIGILLIFAIAYFSIDWIKAPNIKSLFIIGFMWMSLTLLFEFSLGFFVIELSWERIFEDYNLFRGGLMGIGLLLMIFIPYLANKLKTEIKLL